MTFRLMCWLLPFLLGSVVSGCQDKQATPAGTNNELIVSVVDGKLTSNLNPAGLRYFAQRILTKDAELTPAWKNGRVTEAHVELSGVYYYLISQVKDAETGKYIFSSAIELRKDPTDKQSAGLRIGDSGEATTNRPGVEKHTCTGNPCESCGFTRTNGKITGCRCSNPYSSQKCDHTVTTEE